MLVATIPFPFFTVNTFESFAANDNPSRRVGVFVLVVVLLSFTAKTTTKMTTSGSCKSTLLILFATAAATAFVTAFDFHFSDSLSVERSALENESRWHIANVLNVFWLPMPNRSIARSIASSLYSHVVDIAIIRSKNLTF